MRGVRGVRAIDLKAFLPFQWTDARIPIKRRGVTAGAQR